MKDATPNLSIHAVRVQVGVPKYERLKQHMVVLLAVTCIVEWPGEKPVWRIHVNGCQPVHL